VAACAAGVLGGGVAAFQLRGGIIPLLDTVTYWSGARATARGDLFATNLAPSFSNFGAVEFVERGGKLPFVDFPVGYPSLAGLVGTITGVRPALGILVVAAMALVAALVALGPQRAEHRWHPALAALSGVLLVTLPTSRLVTQGVLSEPLFMAASLGLVIVMLRYRDTGRGFGGMIALGVAVGLLRFIGAPLAVLVGREHYTRHRRLVPAIGWAALCATPAGLNVVWAAAAGGGHSPGWRGLEADSIELLVRSVGGWFDARQGDLRITYFGGEGAAWWAWPVTAVWLGAMVWAGLGLLGITAAARRRLPAPLELCLAAAGIVTAGLVAGMMGFDALVVPDNRLMLPAGLLTLAGLIWSLPELAASVRPWLAPMSFAALAVWTITAVRPWNVTERFTDAKDVPAYIEPLVALAPRSVVTNAADGVHWHSGIPAAYAPLPTKALTGEPVDQEAVLRALPCPLWEHDAVVMLVDGALFGSQGDDVLLALVEEGRLIQEALPGATLYVPTPDACF
jgi:hypothetical protein